MPGSRALRLGTVISRTRYRTPHQIGHDALVHLHPCPLLNRNPFLEKEQPPLWLFQISVWKTLRTTIMAAPLGIWFEFWALRLEIIRQSVSAWLRLLPSTVFAAWSICFPDTPAPRPGRLKVRAWTLLRVCHHAVNFAFGRNGLTLDLPEGFEYQVLESRSAAALDDLQPQLRRPWTLR